MDDRGFFLTWQAIRRQLAAMPNELYLVRLIHQQTKKAFPGERLWTATQLIRPATVRFLRVRNREGCDVYFQPYAADQNAGYILVDLDRADDSVLGIMRTQGHDPCVVLQTSPGNLQAWIRLSYSPLDPALATAASKQLAHAYSGDLASTGWRHLGRLAGFTNQKPQRRTPGGYPPWVKVVHAQLGLARRADVLLQAVQALTPSPPCSHRSPFAEPVQAHLAPAEAIAIYRDCMQRWRICQRFPQTDWSIVDLWVAKHLLSLATPAAQVQEILRLASPHFPRRHGDPDGYLCRTIALAAHAVCSAHAESFPTLDPASDCSNSTGER